MIGDILLSFSMIKYLKALLIGVLTTVKDSELCNWQIKVYNYLKFIQNDLDLGVQPLFVLINKFSK